MKKPNRWIPFFFDHDVNGCIEVFYNPKTNEFKEIKNFDDGTETTTRSSDIEMLGDTVMEAFEKQFPEEM